MNGMEWLGMSHTLWQGIIFSYFPFKDFVCPRCDSGFIEEVKEDSRYSSFDVSKNLYPVIGNTPS